MGLAPSSSQQIFAIITRDQRAGHDDPAGRAERRAGAASCADRAYVLETGEIVRAGTGRRAARRRPRCGRPTSAATSDRLSRTPSGHGCPGHLGPGASAATRRLLTVRSHLAPARVTVPRAARRRRSSYRRCTLDQLRRGGSCAGVASRSTVVTRVARPDDLPAVLALVRQHRADAHAEDVLTGHTPGARRRPPASAGCSRTPATASSSPSCPDPTPRRRRRRRGGRSASPSSALDPLSLRARQPAGHRRHLRRAPRAPAVAASGAALLAAAAAYAEETGAAHVVAAVGGHEAERQRFFARMGFAPLTTRRIVARRVARPGRWPPGSAAAGRAGAAPAGGPAPAGRAARPAGSPPRADRRLGRSASGRSAGRWRSAGPARR